MTPKDELRDIIKEVVGKTTKTLYEGYGNADADVWGIDKAIQSILTWLKSSGYVRLSDVVVDEEELAEKLYYVICPKGYWPVSKRSLNGKNCFKQAHSIATSKKILKKRGE